MPGRGPQGVLDPADCWQVASPPGSLAKNRGCRSCPWSSIRSRLCQPSAQTPFQPLGGRKGICIPTNEGVHQSSGYCTLFWVGLAPWLSKESLPSWENVRGQTQRFAGYQHSDFSVGSSIWGKSVLHLPAVGRAGFSSPWGGGKTVAGPYLEVGLWSGGRVWMCQPWCGRW